MWNNKHWSRLDKIVIADEKERKRNDIITCSRIDPIKEQLPDDPDDDQLNIRRL